MVSAVFYFILSLLIIVSIHELGHYIVARACGIKVDAFAVGMGKKLFSFKSKSGTEWKICCLPIGGYVKMYGDDSISSFGGYPSNPSQDMLEYSLFYKHPLKKIAVAFAGPFMNLLLAFLLLVALFSIKGLPAFAPVVSEVIKGSVAEKAGILSRDEILSINGKKIETFYDIGKELNSQVLSIDVRRGNEVLTLNAMLGSDKRLGISGTLMFTSKFDNVSQHIKIGFYDAAKRGFNAVVAGCYGIFNVVYDAIFHQSGLKRIGGPIAIAKESAKAGKNGVPAFIYFLAALSISLGTINLLPVPLLDGGHILINSIELITRRRFSNFAYKIFVILGLTFISALTLVAFVNDIFFRN